MSSQDPSTHPSSGEPTCDDVAALLPWLWNGSLDEREGLLLRAHVEGCEGCRRELAETIEAIEVYAQHVPSLALAEYSQGLEPSLLDRASLEAHLAVCPTCREELALASSAHAVVDFASRRAVRDGRRVSATGLTWRRLAAAAVVALGLGWGLWNVGTSPGDDPAPAPRTAASADRLFTDDFESGDAVIWMSVHEAGPEPQEHKTEIHKTQKTPVFGDGFESGGTSTWRQISG